MNQNKKEDKMLSLFKKLTSVSVMTAALLFSVSVYAKDRMYETDVVVVGVGGAGVAAAVSAAQSGAKVIALEKQEMPGGSSNFAEGLFAVGTPEQKRLYVDVTAEEAFKHAMDFNHRFRINEKLLRFSLKESTKTIEWLKEQGVEFDVFRVSPEEPQVWHLVRSKGNLEHGAALIHTMVTRANELGVKIMYGTPGHKLIYDGKKVKGIEAVDPKGNKVIIKAKAVIIATGGFPNSEEKIAEWTKFDPAKVKAALPLGKTGDGISMAMEVGADAGGFGLMLTPGILGPGMAPFGPIFALSWEPGLWVNKYGERFTDETVIHNFSLAGNVVEGQRDSFVWSIIDEDAVTRAEKEGVVTGAGVLTPVGTKLSNIRAELQTALDAGNQEIAIADTVEELAVKINVEPKRLKKTIDDFNYYKEHNFDEEFARDPNSMPYVKKGKFYAFRMKTYHFVSYGGIKVNNDMQATDKQDKPIEGLYVTGMDVGGLHGDTYTLWTSGAAYSFAATSGRIAGAKAAEYSKMK
jgi:fumarate reductase flavoprotein subunit